MMIRQAFILAGGLGTRLGSLTKETPKPLLEVGGIPFLEYVLLELKRFGISRFVIGIGYLSETIRDCLGNGEKFGVHIEYSQEDSPLGTGGALKHAAHLLDDFFLVLNGDSLAELDYTLFSSVLESGACGMAVRSVPDVSRYGRVAINDDNVTGFAEKAESGPGFINAGVYLLNRNTVDLLPVGKSSLETDLFPKLVNDGALRAVRCGEFFIDIGLPESYNEAQQIVPAYFKRKVAFIDRDGVLNRDDHGYFHKVSEFQWIEDAPAAIRFLNDNNYYVFCITNQSGIGRGYYTQDDYKAVRSHMEELLFKEGAHIDGFYHCPHTPDDGCECRKPRIGLLDRAFSEWAIDRNDSFMIGDKQSDIDAAQNAQLPGFLYKEGSLLTFVKEILNNGRDSEADS